MDLFYYPPALTHLTRYAWDTVDLCYTIPGPLDPSHDMPGIQWTASVSGSLSHFVQHAWDTRTVDLTYIVPGPLTLSHLVKLYAMPGIQVTFSIARPLDT